MNVLHLKYAVEIDKVGSLNKAAENLYMNQPNLSRAIKELESNLGIEIFERSAKGMTATPEGERFLGYARRILAQIDEVESMYREGLVPQKRFSISVPRACYISEAFAQFSRTIDPNDHIELFYKETNAMRAIKNILEADYKLGIIRYAANYDRNFREMLDERGLAHKLITEFSYKLIMSRSHPLAEKDDIRYDDLKPFIEINHADPYVPSLPFAAVRKEELPDMDRRIFVFERASQFDLLSENHRTYMWVSPAPQKVLDRYDLVMKTCRDNGRVYRDVLIHHKDYHLSELDNQFITALCNAKREYL